MLSNMLSKFKSVDVLRHFLPRAARVYGGDGRPISGFSRFFCNTAPEMLTPGGIDEAQKSPWAKFCEGPAGSDDEDDILFPSIADRIEKQELPDLGRAVTDVPIEAAASDACKILNNRFESLEEVAEALAGYHVEVSESLVEHLLERFSHHWITALGIFNWAKAQPGYVPSTKIYDRMIYILGNRGKFDLMWKLAEETKIAGLSCSPATMMNIIQTQVRACQWTDAIDAFRRAERLGVSRDVKLLRNLISFLACNGGVKHAEDAFLEFRDMIPPDASVYNALIMGWCSAGKLDIAPVAEKYPEPDSYVSSALEESREKVLSFDAVLDEMRLKGCPPNSVTYTIIMNSLGKDKKVDEALGVFGKMKQSGCDPDATTYGTLIAGLVSAKRLDEARAMFKDMKELRVFPTVKTYNVLILHYCHRSKEEDALNLLLDMEASGCQPNEETYIPLLKMCCKRKRMKILYFLLGHMVENNVIIDRDIYGLLVSGLCRSGKVEHACLFYEECALRGWAPWNSMRKVLMEKLEKKKMKGAIEMIVNLGVITGQEADSLQAETDDAVDAQK